MTTTTIFQIVLVLIGVIAQVGSVVIEKNTLKRILSIVAAITIILAAFWFGSTFSSQQDLDEVSENGIHYNTQDSLYDVFPTLLESYDFEQGISLPWAVHPSHEDGVLGFNVNVDNRAHSGKMLLNVEANLTEESPSLVLTTNINQPDAQAIVGFIFVPETIRSENHHFYATWVVGTPFGENSANLNVKEALFKSPEIIGDAVTFRAGEWVPVFLSAGTGYRERGDLEKEIIWKKGIYDTILYVWSEEPYAGEILVDDIQVRSR